MRGYYACAACCLTLASSRLCFAASAGPTVATSSLALQVPLAVLLDALIHSPAWLSHAGSAVLTCLGAAAVLGSFFGVNAVGEDDEKTRHALWEAQQEVGH